MVSWLLSLQIIQRTKCIRFISISISIRKSFRIIDILEEEENEECDLDKSLKSKCDAQEWIF